MNKKTKRILSLMASVFFIVSILVNINNTPVKATGWNEDKINQKISVRYTNDSSKITSATICVKAAKTASSTMPISEIQVDNNSLDLSNITLDGYDGKMGSITVTKDGTYKVYVSAVNGMAYKYTDIVVSGIGKTIGNYTQKVCANNSSYSVDYYTSGYGKTVTLYIDMDSMKIKVGGSSNASIDVDNTIPYDVNTNTAFEKYAGNIYKFTYDTNGSKIIKMVGGYSNGHEYYFEINQIDKFGPTINAQVSDNSWTNAESLTINANAYDGQAMISYDNIFLDSGNLLTYSNFSTVNGWTGNQVGCYVENCSESPTGKCLSINASQAGYGVFTRALNNSIKTNKAYLTFYAKCEKEENFYGGMEGVECYNFIVKTTWTKITIPLTKCKDKSGAIILYPRGACGKFSIHSPTLTDGWLPGGYVESTTEMSNISGNSSVSTSLQVFDNGTYTLKAKDKAGNISTKEIKIQNIDRVAPVLTNVKYDNSIVTTKGTITFSASDIDSGISKVKINNKELILTSDNNYSYEITANSDYKIEITDKAGNSVSQIVQVTNLDSSEPLVISEVTEYKDGKAKVKVKAIPQGAAKIKSYSYEFIDKTATFSLTPSNNKITGEGNLAIIDIDDSSYVEGSFVTETNQISNFTINGYEIIIDKAIHEDNWLNKYVATQLGKEIADLTIDDIKSIKNIDFQNQGITEIPYSIKYMENLETLNLANNNLTKIPSFIGNLKKLKELNVSGNYNLDKSTIPATSAKVYTSSTTTVTSKGTTSTSGDIDITFTQGNTIELTLSTNEISFGDINGITESNNTTPDKLVIKVQSSLSYDLNINAESDFIGQTNNNNIIPIEKLQYNVNNNNYISMTKNTTVIANDKAATLGNKDSYNLSFKLQQTIGYAKDSYKANIKVTALQK